MNMNSRFLVLVLSLSLFACVKENTDESDDITCSELKEVMVSLPEIGQFDTKSTFIMDDQGVKVLWAEGDVLGIFPNVGDQVYFPMSSGAGSSSAKFDGGGWGLKDTKTYSSYFPFSQEYYSSPHDAVLLNYKGQCQTGNDSPMHLGAFDYLASGPAAPQSGYLSISLTRMGAIACFRIQVPQPGTYTSALISSDLDFVTRASLDVTANPPTVTPAATSKSIKLTLNNVTITEENETLVLYMMLCPIDLSGAESLKISLQGVEHSYVADLPKKNVVAGKPYMFTASGIVEAIAFADQNVKQICVSNWDVNGDGEIEYDEIADVTELHGFQGHSDIRSFDELKYFTSLPSIPDNAFANCSSLTSVVLPPTVSSIGAGAFSGCSRLKNINFDNRAFEIGNGAFRNCSVLEGTINIADGVTDIPPYAFYGCGALSEIVLPSTVKTIGERAFSECRSLTSIELPNGLELIESYVFSGCSNLSTLQIPDNAMAGAYGLFSGCSNLEEVNIPSCWNVLGDAFFSGCSKLETMNVPSNIIHIGGSCFESSGLKSINLPSTLLSLDENSFRNCTSLESIIIPEKVKTIPTGCFSGCTSLSEVILPEGLVSIAYKGRYAFDNCTSLKQITLPQSLKQIGAYAFFCSGLTSIVIPDGVDIIELAAFERCYDMTEVVLPSGLTMIDAGLFFANNLKSIVIPASVEQIFQGSLPGSLEKIVVMAENPPKLISVDVIPDTNCPIFVPDVSKYLADPIWSTFEGRFQPLSDLGVEIPGFDGPWE